MSLVLLLVDPYGEILGAAVVQVSMDHGDLLTLDLHGKFASHHGELAFQVR